MALPPPSQVLFILGVEEDAQQHALPLAEVTWRPHLADPTLVYIDKVMPEPKPQNPDMEVRILVDVLEGMRG